MWRVRWDMTQISFWAIHETTLVVDLLAVKKIDKIRIW